MRVIMGLGILVAMAAPASAGLLLNGDMTLPTLATPSQSDVVGPIDGWTHFGVGNSIRNASANVGSPRWCPPDIGTAPYASTGYSGEDRPTGFYQVVSGLKPGITVTLDGWLGGKTNNLKDNVYLAILEQQASDPYSVSGAVVRKPAGSSSAFSNVQVSYVVPASGQVTVQWGSLGNTGTWGVHMCHADRLVLTPEPVSLLLFALGIPFVLGRRRA